MIQFLLNDKEISTSLPAGMVLLDFIRYHQHLMGTKIGCREGDCGACTVLVGEISTGPGGENGELQYRSMTCCLLPLGNAHGKHIVTIEGVSFHGSHSLVTDQHTPPLSPVQQAMADEGATQCGFCTPGFVVSLAGFCLNNTEAKKENAIAAVDGNICRCTGYKSIERAAGRIAEFMKERNNEDPAVFVARKNILPSYFSSVKEKLWALQQKTNGIFTTHNPQLTTIVGGGTDLYVQKHDEMKDAAIRFLFDHPELNGVTQEGNKCFIGPSATVTDLKNSAIIQNTFPDFDRYARLVSSTPIRNMATIAGNFINASPIGDFTIFFLALDTQLILSDGKTKRELPLRKLYKDYKILDKKTGEYIEKIWFELPGKNTKFHFEKVSKRTNLDIATVNTAMSIRLEKDRITVAAISAGGVGPVPMYLKTASGFLKDKIISKELITQVIEKAQAEISPISDARGTAEYKRLLLGQLIKAHFMELFPGLKAEFFLTN